MTERSIRHFFATTYGQLVLAALLLLGALFLLPNNRLIADAIRRATGTPSVPIPAPPAPVHALSVPEGTDLPALWSRFGKGQSLQVQQLQYLLADGARFANVETLVSLARHLDRAGLPSATLSTTYNIMSAGRTAVALAFLEMRPDGNDTAHWRLRFSLNRSTNNANAALGLLQSASRTPGFSKQSDLIAAAYEVNRPEFIVAAAENGAIGRLDRTLSLDLARRAAAAGQTALLARIDRVGTPDWRRDDPWLAMKLARQSGDIDGAMRYAAMLPAGGGAAQQSIILGSGNPAAIRRLLLDQAASTTANRPAIAQQLLETGFRNDAIDVLQRAADGQAPDQPDAARLLFLMGPRPDASGLAWLRDRAQGDAAWLPVYIDREQPGVALAFVERRQDASDTRMALLRLRLAAAARNRDAAIRAYDLLLDGRPLAAGQIKSATQQMMPGLPARYVLALAKARLATGAALPTDRRDLAWAAWNRKDYRAVQDHLRGHLAIEPGDAEAVRLMANAVAKTDGAAPATPWLERALALAPENSRQRLDVLEQLGRKTEALAMVEQMHARAPHDRELAIIHSRLLIAAGHPGRAQKVLGL